MPGARRPSTPSTARVAGWPETSLAGSTIETAQVVAEVDCAGAVSAGAEQTAEERSGENSDLSICFGRVVREGYQPAAHYLDAGGSTRS